MAKYSIFVPEFVQTNERVSPKGPKYFEVRMHEELGMIGLSSMKEALAAAKKLGFIAPIVGPSTKPHRLMVAGAGSAVLVPQ